MVPRMESRRRRRASSTPPTLEQHATDARTPTSAIPGVDNTEPAPTPLSASAHVGSEKLDHEVW